MLDDGSIAEMKTGEGKTLVSTLAAYLNALTGEGVHGMLSILKFLEVVAFQQTAVVVNFLRELVYLCEGVLKHISEVIST